MSTYEDLLRSLLVERFTPIPRPDDDTPASQRLADLTRGLREERRRTRAPSRTPRRQASPTNIIESPRRTS